DGAAIGHGLPARPLDLAELRDLLLAPGASPALKDAAWLELVERSRNGGPDWVIGWVGGALTRPGSAAARVIRSCPVGLADREDIVSGLLIEFVAQLARVNTSRPYIAARLLLWAYKGGLRARNQATRQPPLDPHEMADTQTAPTQDP